MLDRTKAPEIKTFPTFKLPQFDTLILDNGFKLYLVQNSSQPLAGFMINVKKGAGLDKIDGSSYLSSLMLTRGTSKMNSAMIADSIESIGGKINVSPGYDDLTFSSTSLNEFLPNMMKISSDCFFNSIFEESEFSKVLKKHKASIILDNSDINSLSQLLFQRTYYAGTPYEKIIQGTLKSIKQISRDDIYKNYLNNINSSPASIIFFGNFNKDKIISFVNDKFSNIDLSGKQETITNFPSPLIKVAAIDKNDSNQSILRLARPIINRRHPDYPYIQLVNTIFSGYFMSRLNKILREEKGYTYGVNSGIENMRESAVLKITAGVNIDKTAESISIIHDVFSDLKSIPITDEELQRAVRYTTGSFLRGTETTNQVAMLIKSIDLWELKNDYFEQVYDKMVNAKLENLHDAVEKYFTGSNFVITAAGDLKKTQSQLEEFGKVNIFEIEN